MYMCTYPKHVHMHLFYICIHVLTHTHAHMHSSYICIHAPTPTHVHMHSPPHMCTCTHPTHLPLRGCTTMYLLLPDPNMILLLWYNFGVTCVYYHVICKWRYCNFFLYNLYHFALFCCCCLIALARISSNWLNR